MKKIIISTLLAFGITNCNPAVDNNSSAVKDAEVEEMDVSSMIDEKVRKNALVSYVTVMKLIDEGHANLEDLQEFEDGFETFLTIPKENNTYNVYYFVEESYENVTIATVDANLNIVDLKKGQTYDPENHLPEITESGAAANFLVNAISFGLAIQVSKIGLTEYAPEQLNAEVTAVDGLLRVAIIDHNNSVKSLSFDSEEDTFQRLIIDLM